MGTALAGRFAGRGEFIWPFAVQVLALAMPFVIIPYLTRTLGAFGFGQFAFCQAFATVGAAVVDYGFQISATRALAQSRDDIAAVTWRSSGVLAAKLLIACLFLAASLAFLPLYPGFFRSPAMIGGAMAFALFQGLNFYWLFAGLQRVLFASMLDLGARFSAVLGILLLVHHPDQTWVAIWCFAGGNAAAFLCACVIARRQLPGLGLSFAAARAALHEGRHIFVQNVFGNIYVGATSFILGLFVSPYFVGVFSGAEKLVRAAQLPLIPMRLAAYPRVLSRIHESREEGAKLVRQLALLVLPVMGAGSLILFFAAEPIVRLLLGPKLQDAAILLRVMAFLPFLSAASDLISTFWLLPTGRDRAVTGIVVASLAGQIGLIALLAQLVPRWAGAAGTTGAQLIALTLCLVCLGLGGTKKAAT